MVTVTDLNAFKYRKDIYYIEVRISRGILMTLMDVIDDKLCNIKMTDEEYIAYEGLKGSLLKYIGDSNSEHINVKIHKFYSMYIRMICGYYVSSYKTLSKVSQFMDNVLLENEDLLGDYNNLSTDFKISILKSIGDSGGKSERS